MTRINPGIAALVVAYMLSQFYRAFLAVLSPALAADLGATPDDLARASALWFASFAAMQIPVGAALDRFGPRRTSAILLALGGGGGALLFAVATTPLHIWIAVALIGIGCAPVLMASYYIFARSYCAARFGKLAGLVIVWGLLGSIASATPLAWAAEALGWRGVLVGLSATGLITAATIWITVQDPKQAETQTRGSVFDLLRQPALWPVFAVMFVAYAPAAGIRGLWVGPYAQDVFGADALVIGRVTLVMSVAMIAGTFAYGPLERLLGTRKWLIIGGNFLAALALAALWALPAQSLWLSGALLAVLGAAGASFPIVVAHARAFFPAHLAGRGMTLINLFGIGGAGIVQFASGPLHRSLGLGATNPATAYAGLFAALALLIAFGLILYLAAPDRTD